MRLCAGLNSTICRSAKPRRRPIDRRALPCAFEISSRFGFSASSCASSSGVTAAGTATLMRAVGISWTPVPSRQLTRTQGSGRAPSSVRMYAILFSSPPHE
jgi:hypothetical protein